MFFSSGGQIHLSSVVEFVPVLRNKTVFFVVSVCNSITGLVSLQTSCYLELRFSAPWKLWLWHVLEWRSAENGKKHSLILLCLCSGKRRLIRFKWEDWERSHIHWSDMTGGVSWNNKRQNKKSGNVQTQRICTLYLICFYPCKIQKVQNNQPWFWDGYGLDPGLAKRASLNLKAHLYSYWRKMAS